MHLDGHRSSFASFRRFALDTTFVLFFLGLEFGRTLGSVSFDAVLMFATISMVAVLPYYLPSDAERPAFSKWLMGRSVITILATGLGSVLSQAYGTLLPESFRFMPLTLLIVAAMTSCFVQFYGLMRLRLAK
jgi:hypothetical protein